MPILSTYYTHLKNKRLNMEGIIWQKATKLN